MSSVTTEIHDDGKYQVMPELDAEEYRALKDDIQENGVIVPITVDEEGHIIDGYHRWQACQELDINDPPIRQRTGLSEEEKVSLAWRLNMQRRHVDKNSKKDLVKKRINQLINRGINKTDEELADEMGCTQPWVTEVRKTVVNKKLLQDGSENISGYNFRTVADYATSEQKEKFIKDVLVENPEKSNNAIANQIGVDDKTVGKYRGELPKLHRPQLLNTEAETALDELPDESVDLIVTDPPYGIGFNGNRYQTDSYDELRGDQDTTQITSIASQLERVLKPDRHIYIFCRWDVLGEVIDAYSDYFDVDTVIVWDKCEGGHGMGDLTDWAPRHELIVKASKGSRPLQEGRPANVIRQQDVRFTDDDNIHPTQKPTELIKTLIKQSCEPEELILDPFGGVYTIAAAAIETNCRCISYELDPDYHASGRDRIQSKIDNHASQRTMILETEVPE